MAAADLATVDHAAGQALVELAERVGEKRPGDNVSLPTFFRLVDALGMTPAARRALAVAAGGKASDGDGGAGAGGDEGSAKQSELERKRAQLRARLGGASA